MAFSEEWIPRIFQKLLVEIKERDTINYQEFRNLIYSLRIDEEDVDEIASWLKRKNIINLKKGRHESIVSINHFELNSPTHVLNK